jgi:para-nitrobenzyl esterase
MASTLTRSEIVETTHGRVQGLVTSGIRVFRGIRYGASTAGANRFRPPQPPEPWSGVLETVDYGQTAPQTFSRLALGGTKGNRPEIGEDCLVLNVWTPACDAQKRPVLLWLHGGGFEAGTGSVILYDGTNVSRRGDVVVVTINHRLNLFGHTYLADLLGDEFVDSANAGFLDVVAALEWVRDNIRAFGGDPDRVAVFGQSAGGGSVAALLAIDRAAGLFRRAVAQSVPGTFFSPELAADITAACAAELGLRPTVADLSSVAPRQLSAAADTVGAKMDQWAHRWGRPAHRTILFSPVVDGEVLAVTPWQALTDGTGRDIELLVGHTRDEQRLFTAINGLLGEVSDEQAANALHVLAPGPDGARRYRDAFPAAGPDELYELVHSDWLFRMPSLHLAEAQTAARGRAHVYELTWPAPGMGGALGACHGLDVPLVFGNLDRGQPALLIGETPSPEAEALSTQMRAAWASFAAHGDPGWPAYDTDQRLVQRFDTRPAVTAYPEEPSRLIWQSHTFPALRLISR